MNTFPTKEERLFQRAAPLFALLEHAKATGTYFYNQPIQEFLDDGKVLVNGKETPWSYDGQALSTVIETGSFSTPSCSCRYSSSYDWYRFCSCKRG